MFILPNENISNLLYCYSTNFIIKIGQGELRVKHSAHKYVGIRSFPARAKIKQMRRHYTNLAIKLIYIFFSLFIFDLFSCWFRGKTFWRRRKHRLTTMFWRLYAASSAPFKFSVPNRLFPIARICSATFPYYLKTKMQNTSIGIGATTTPKLI